MTSLMAEAIRKRRLISISYSPGQRLVEPHAVGISKDGKALLRAYQVSGASASSEHEHWKIFRIDRMGSVEMSGDTFSGPRHGYRRGDSAMKGGIIAEL